MMDEMEKAISCLFEKTSFSFENCFSLLFQGQIKECLCYVADYLRSVTVGSVIVCKEVLLTVLLLGILGCIFQIFSDSFENKQVSRIAQGIFVCLAAILLLGIYEQGYEMCKTFLENEEEFLKILLPAFCITLTVGTGAATGYSYYELTLFVLYIMQLFLQLVFFPLIHLYVVFVLLNSLERQKRFGQAQKLCQTVIEWGSRVGMYVGVGSFFIQGMLYPKLDGSKRSLVMKGIGMIPGIGEVSESASEVLIASAELTRNCLGIAGGISLILLAALPILKLTVSGAGMKLLGSVLEMVGEHKISALTNRIGTAQFYFVRMMLCEAGILLLSFAVIALCTNHG
jgi:stage III sporulation protein AE